MKGLEGLERFAPGLGELSPEELVAIQRFTLLWTLFEAQALGTQASAERIVDMSSRWERESHLDVRWYEPGFQYFKARYIEEGRTNGRFERLHFNDGRWRDLTLSTLCGWNDAPSNRLSASLLIVHRLRNNFFHGTKWAYELKGQQENFEHASQLLEGCLDVVHKLRS